MSGKREQRKLSEVARHIVKPAGIVSTGWPAVRDRCRYFGVEFDRWQDGLGRLTFSKRADGQYAAGTGGVLLSVARQVGKTFLFMWSVMALATIREGTRIIWTAHHSRTSDDAFNKMASMARSARLSPFVKQIKSGNSGQVILFTNGSVIEFGAREHGYGRGLDRVDVLVFDEAQILKDNALSNMTPATNASANGLILMMGTPPRPQDPGDAFKRIRHEALTGIDDTVAYVEISADEDAKIIDWKQVEKANPAYPHRVGKAAIMRMRKFLGSDDDFRREAYGIWDREITEMSAFAASEWKTLKGPKPKDVQAGALGVKFTADGAGVSLAAAWRDAHSQVYIEPLRQANAGEGTEWLVAQIAAMRDEVSRVVIDGRSGVGYLVEALQDAGITNKRFVIVPSLNDVIAAHSMFFQAVKTGTLSHPGVKAFDDQVLGAKKRKIGSNGGFGWDPLTEGETVVSLDAATLAYWGAKTAKSKGGARLL